MRLIRTLALGLGLLGVFIASQLPEFEQQYRQRLGGAIDELATVVQRFDADAAANGLSRDNAIMRLAQSPDDVVRRRAIDARSNVDRLAARLAQRDAMNNAGPVGRIFRFLGAPDRQLIDATMRDFEPAIPTTSEGLLIALAGFVVGWSLVHIVAWPWKRWRERRLLRRPAGEPNLG
jgi:hypothetical protein